MKTPSCLIGFVLGLAAYMKSSLADQTTDYAQQLFDQSKQLVVRSTRSGLCLERGSEASSTMAFSECGSATERQTFVYNQASGQFQTPGTVNCVDFGSLNSPSFRIQVCSADSTTQQLSFDLTTGHIASIAQPGQCLDSATGVPQLVACQATESSQVFTVVAKNEVETHSTTYVTTATGAKITVPDVFHNQKPFLLAGKHKSNLCLSDGGLAQLNGNTTFEMATCGADASAQTFVFDPLTLQIKSVARVGLCINDGKGPQLPPFLHLERCAAGNTNQRWILDESSNRLFNPNATSVCVDDGGGLMPGQSKVYVDWCRDGNTNQAFQIVPTTYIPPVVTK